MIAVLTQEQVIEKVERSVFFHPTPKTAEMSDEFLAQIIRRAIYVMAPCLQHELIRAVTQSLEGLGCDELDERVERLTDDLIAFGDILEMSVEQYDTGLRPSGFVLRPAPPSFVARPDNSLVLLGIAGDYISPLTSELEQHVISRGVLRIIPNASADTQTVLRDLGLLKLSERAWLRLPAIETAVTHVVAWRQRVGNEPQATGLHGIQILDTSRSPTFYKDRWCDPTAKHSGFFVARRPQKYGASLWCVVEMEQGSVRRFKDLSSPGDRLRPYDLAWRIQAALDSIAGTPQRFRCSSAADSTTLVRFYSPIPSWCERHLAITGVKTKTDRCLFAFEIPNAAASNELKLLREALWMTEIAE
jgi:hypothetical protein